MNELFNGMRSCEEAVRQYFLAFDVYRQAEQDEINVQKEYYINHQKKLLELEKSKKVKGNFARNAIKNYAESVLDQINVLINDIKDTKRIIMNADDFLVSPEDAQMTPKFAGKTIADSLVEVGDYLSALIYRMTSASGDLTRDALNTISAINSLNSVDKTEAEDKETKTEKSNENINEDYNPDDSSILSELDKLDDSL